MSDTRVISMGLGILLIACLAWGQSDPNLVGYWNFDDQAVTDLSGNGNHGILVGNAGFNEEWGFIGHSLDLNYQNTDTDYVEIPDSNSLSSINKELTFAAWIWADEIQAFDGIASKGNVWKLQLLNTPNKYLRFIGNQGDPNVYVDPNELVGNNAFRIQLDVPEKEWAFVGFTSNGTEMAFYLDDQILTSAQSFIFGRKDEPLVLGVNSDGNDLTPDNYLNGLMDEVRVYNRALSQREMKALWGGFEGATDPIPAHEATGVFDPMVSWLRPLLAQIQEVYAGLDPNSLELVHTLTDGSTQVELDLVPNQTLYWRVDVTDANGTSTGDLWQFTTADIMASQPIPADNGIYLALPDNGLKWIPGLNVVSQDIYIGLDRATIEAADRHSPDFKDTLPSDQLSYHPSGLIVDTKHFWRVGTVLADGTVQAGPVWSFLVMVPPEPDPNMLAWYLFDDGAGNIAKDISGNGYDATIQGTTSWVGPDQAISNYALSLDGPDGTVELPLGQVWGQLESFTIMTWLYLPDTDNSWQAIFSFGNDNNHHITWTSNRTGGADARMQAWNGPNKFDTDPFDGSRVPEGVWVHVAATLDGPNQTVVLYKDGIEWGRREDVTVTPSSIGPTVNNYIGYYPRYGNYLIGIFDDYRIYDVALDQEHIRAASLGDTRKPGNLSPANTEVHNLEESVVLSWTPGAGASAHEVYFGMDPNNLTLQATVTDATTYDLGRLETEQTYYWQIRAKVNDTIFPGATWNFTIADYIELDGFDRYTNVDEELNAWDVWFDGYAGNNTGSTIDFVTTEIKHDGTQSAPLLYNNRDGFNISEISLTYDSPQDFTREGMKSLSFWFYGELENTVEASDQIYVTLEDSLGKQGTIPYQDLANWLIRPTWSRYQVAISDFAGRGVDVTKIGKLIIGVGNPQQPTTGGAGTLYLDTLRLYPPICTNFLDKDPADLNQDCVVDALDLEILTNNWLASGVALTPSDPGAQGLVGHWPLDEIKSTSYTPDVVNQIDSWLYGATEVAGKIAGALYFSDPEDTVELGAHVGEIVSELNSFTASIWVNLDFDINKRMRAWRFENDNGDLVTMDLTRNMFGRASGPLFEIDQGGVNEDVRTGGIDRGEWVLLIGRLDADKQLGSLWINGELIEQGTFTHTPSDLGVTTQNNLGYNPAADQYLKGALDDFRLYNRALSEAEIRYLAQLPGAFSSLVGQTRTSDINGDHVVDQQDKDLLEAALGYDTLWPKD